MGKVLAFLLKRRVRTLFRRVFRRRSSSSAYRRLEGNRVKPLSKIMNWTHRLRTKAEAILYRNRSLAPGFIQAGQEPLLENPGHIPKGHIAVYVGKKDRDFQRILMPIVYFNHPLFGDLLRESEKEYGFNHPGAITIPCRISEFERIQTRIKTGQCPRKLMSWRMGRSSVMMS